MLIITKLTCEYATELLGVDESNPRFSWIIEADGKNITQKAYHLHVATNQDFTNKYMDTVYDWLKPD